ncbi:MAG: hypothetical protein ABEI39_05930 [Halobacteriales archaeon]
MDGLLNEVTGTVHRHETGRADLQAECSATSQVAHEHLRLVPVESATADAERCDRCFEDGSGD